MSTYRVRRLHCLGCDAPVRVRNRLLGDSEVLSRCPECNSNLVSIGQLNTAAPASDFEFYSNVSGRPAGFLRPAVNDVMGNFWDNLAPEINAEYDKRWSQFMREELGEG